ncbi:MAG TPA: hypothetical protein VFG87_26255 [Amycolatopsis sp.]|jgi:hypothetical protein|nr:hypothetical protein [Amycolatopsis sp.]
MNIAHGLLLMAVVFFAVWVLFAVVSETIIRRDRRSGKDGR